MGLNEGLIKSLENELARLKEDKRNLENDIFQIETFLSQTQKTTKVVFYGDNTGSFRDVIRRIITDYPNGVRPKDVVKDLDKVGYKYLGESPIAVRVCSELMHMVRSGELHKRERGVYRLNN